MKKPNKPQMKFSNREKRLLTILGVVLIITGGGKFLILPQISNIKDQKTELEVLQVSADEKREKIAAMDTLEAELSAAKKEFNKMRNVVIESTNNEVTDGAITSMVRSCGIDTEILSIQDLSTEDGEPAATPGSFSRILPKRVSISVSGGGDALRRIIDTANGRSYIIVESLDSYGAKDENKTMSMVMSVYTRELMDFKE